MTNNSLLRTGTCWEPLGSSDVSRWLSGTYNIYFRVPAADFHSWAAFSSCMKLAVALCGVCLMTGCDKHAPVATVRNDRSVSVSDPALISKLGITAQEWTSIEELASRNKGLVMKDAERINVDAIDVKMKKADDARGEQGGPVQRFKWNDGRWMLQSNYDGWWASGK